jgi:hypothetical protein
MGNCTQCPRGRQVEGPTANNNLTPARTKPCVVRSHSFDSPLVLQVVCVCVSETEADRQICVGGRGRKGSDSLERRHG